MRSRSAPRTVSRSDPDGPGDAGSRSPASGSSSISAVRTGASAKRAVRSITLPSSRTLPGHG